MQNGYIKSFNGKFRNERLNDHRFTTLSQTRDVIANWHAGLDLLDESDDLLGGESTLAHVRPHSVNGLYLLSAGTAGGGAGQSPQRPAQQDDE